MCGKLIDSDWLDEKFTKMEICLYFIALKTLEHVVVIPYVSDYSMDLSEIPNRF